MNVVFSPLILEYLEIITGPWLTINYLDTVKLLPVEITGMRSNPTAVHTAVVGVIILRGNRVKVKYSG